MLINYFLYSNSNIFVQYQINLCFLLTFYSNSNFLHSLTNFYLTSNIFIVINKVLLWLKYFIVLRHFFIRIQIFLCCLTLSRRRPISYRNQSIDLQGWFNGLVSIWYGLRRERVNKFYSNSNIFIRFQMFLCSLGTFYLNWNIFILVTQLWWETVRLCS